MKQRVIYLTESDLHDMVNESVNNILIKEGFWGTFTDRLAEKNPNFAKMLGLYRGVKGTAKALKSSQTPTDDEGMLTQDRVVGDGKVARLLRAMMQGLKDANDERYLDLLQATGADVTSARYRMQLTKLQQECLEAQNRGNIQSANALMSQIQQLEQRYWNALCTDMEHYFQRQAQSVQDKSEKQKAVIANNEFKNWLKTKIANAKTEEEKDFFTQRIQGIRQAETEVTQQRKQEREARWQATKAKLENNYQQYLAQAKEQATQQASQTQEDAIELEYNIIAQTCSVQARQSRNKQVASFWQEKLDAIKQTARQYAQQKQEEQTREQERQRAEQERQRAEEEERIKQATQQATQQQGTNNIWY